MHHPLPAPDTTSSASVQRSAMSDGRTAPGADGISPAPRELPNCNPFPAPDTLSEALTRVVNAPPNPQWSFIPENADAWREAAARISRGNAFAIIGALKDRLGVTVERETIAGVPVFISTPRHFPEVNHGRWLLHLHGGSYILFSGVAAAGEAIMMSGYGGFRIISIDYRQSPDFTFPAPLDDIVAVYKEMIRYHDPKRLGVFGTSSGGTLTLSTIHRLKLEGLPLPAAIAPGSPSADFTRRGDTLRTNAHVDNTTVTLDGWAGAALEMYRAGTQADHPLLSPIYGDFTGFPPAILTAGTRDLFLSDTVRVHRKLRQARVQAVLQVFEAQSHAQFLTPFAPETEEALGEIAGFLGAHLAR